MAKGGPYYVSICRECVCEREKERKGEDYSKTVWEKERGKEAPKSVRGGSYIKTRWVSVCVCGREREKVKKMWRQWEKVQSEEVRERGGGEDEKGKERGRDKFRKSEKERCSEIEWKREREIERLT